MNISLNKLMVKGPAKFKTINKNHILVKKGVILRTPLLLTRLRLWLRSYIMFAALNIPEDVTPCAIIIHKPPTRPSTLFLEKTTITILM